MIDGSRNANSFRSASLLVFTSHHELMMKERPSGADPQNRELTKDVFMHRTFRKQLEQKIDVDYFKRSTMQLQLNEVHLYDDPVFPAYRTTTDTSFLHVADTDCTMRQELEGVVGEPMFELTLELNSLKTVHERSATSFIMIGGICVAAALFMYWLMSIVFQAIMLTQGSKLIQNLMYGLY